MSDAVEQKALDLMDKGGAALGQFADKLGELAKQYGPDVVNAALDVARVDAANQLVPPLLVGVAMIVAWPLLIKRAYPWAAATGDIDAYAVPIIGSAAATIASLWSAANLADIWAWVGIFEPKLWIAHRLLKL